jgi:O-antigen ligase
VAIYQFATASEEAYRAIGILENTNMMGNMSVVAFSLCFYQFLYRVDRLRWLSLGLCGILFGGVVVSASRTSTVSFVLVMLAAMIVERRRALPMMLVVVLIVASAPFVPGYYHERMSNLATDIKNTFVIGKENEELTPRGRLNKGGLKIWMTRPLLGIGIGNFGHYFVEREFNPGFKRSNKVPPHNLYLQALVEMGIVGLAVLIWMLAQAGWHVLQARRIGRKKMTRWPYFGGIQLMLFVIVLTSFTGGTVLRNDIWLFLCLAVLSHRIAATDSEEEGLEEGLPAEA